MLFDYHRVITIRKVSIGTIDQRRIMNLIWKLKGQNGEKITFQKDLEEVVVGHFDTLFKEVDGKYLGS